MIINKSQNTKCMDGFFKVRNTPTERASEPNLFANAELQKFPTLISLAIIFAGRFFKHVLLEYKLREDSCIEIYD